MAENIYDIYIKWKRNDKKESLLTPEVYHISFESGYNLEVSPSTTPLKASSQIHPLELFGSSIFTSNVKSYLQVCEKNGLRVISVSGGAQVITDPKITDRQMIQKIVLKPRFVFEGCNDQECRALAVRLIHEARHECAIDSSISCQLEIEPLLIWA